MGSSSPLSPTFYGHIASTQDALLLFEACLSGALSHVARRPHDRERSSLIKSGNVFIYEEHSSGIKRWTDGVPWSPSRILGNFLVYRELERPFPPGEKKRAMKRAKRSPGISKTGLYGGYSYEQGSTKRSLSKETERSLIGSLVDSYGFKEEGLVKKTVSVTVGGVSHHLVSYYTVADVMSNKFNTPSKDARFQHINPRSDLISEQNFRTPIDEVDPLDRMDDRSVYSAYAYTRNEYDMTNQTLSHRPLSLSTPSVHYAQNPNLFPGYGMTTNQTVYENYSAGSSGNGYGGQFVPAVGVYTNVKTDNHDVFSQRQQRFGSAVDLAPDRSPMSATNWPPRRSSTFGQSHSVDSAASGMSSTSSDSKDSGYASQGFFGSHRDSSHPQQYPRKVSLPTPTFQTTYDRAAVQPYSNMDHIAGKNNIWPMGNTSPGHGHYMAPQQWASAGTS